jgi:hypothetical protein
MSYASMAQGLASSRIASHGAQVTLTHTTVGTYDPVAGAPATSSVVATVSAVLDVNSTKRLGFVFGDGLVKSGDIMATISGDIAFPPSPGDVLTVLDGPLANAYCVVDSRPSMVEASAVYWNLLVRR